MYFKSYILLLHALLSEAQDSEQLPLMISGSAEHFWKTTHPL